MLSTPKIVANLPSASAASASSARQHTALFQADTPYMKTTPISDELVEKFQTLRKAFPEDADVVSAGGWYNLERLSVDPKQEFVGMVTEGLKSTDDSMIQFGETYQAHDTEKLEALLLLLYGMGKGFEADTVDGEWDLVFTRQGKKSPAFQKFVGNKETAGLSKNFFDIASMTFSGIVKFWKWGKVATKAKYETSSDAFSYNKDGKIVLRRIVVKLVNAWIKWWKLPGLPIPVPRKKGYLDVVYLDEDLRVTKGNRGGLFVHMRPAYLKKVLSD
ncbi:MAG: hypothetical protein SGILL_003845 [Bacillariaceae sp.]